MLELEGRGRTLTSRQGRRNPWSGTILEDLNSPQDEMKRTPSRPPIDGG